MQQSINIDKMVHERRCPEPRLCSVGASWNTVIKRRNICSLCWETYCLRKRIKFYYGWELYDPGAGF